MWLFSYVLFADFYQKHINKNFSVYFPFMYGPLNVEQWWSKLQIIYIKIHLNVKERCHHIVLNIVNKIPMWPCITFSNYLLDVSDMCRGICLHETPDEAMFYRSRSKVLYIPAQVPPLQATKLTSLPYSLLVYMST